MQFVSCPCHPDVKQACCFFHIIELSILVRLDRVSRWKNTSNEINHKDAIKFKSLCTVKGRKSDRILIFVLFRITHQLFEMRNPLTKGE